MRTGNLFCTLSFAVITMCLAAPTVFASTSSLQEMADMSERMDQIEKQDFQVSIDKANSCTRARDFSCTDLELGKATKLVNSTSDRAVLAEARHNMAVEKEQIAEEARLRAEEQRRQAAAAEQQRIALAEQRRQQEAQSGGFQWSKLAALGVGAAIGGIGNLSAEDQTRFITSAVKDSMAGQEGVGNLKGTTDSMRAEQEARQAAAAQQEQQRHANAMAAEAANNERLLKAARESRQPGTGQKNLAVQNLQPLATAKQVAVNNSANAPRSSYGNGGEQQLAQSADFDALGSQLPKTESYTYSCGRFSGVEMMARESADNCIAEEKRFMEVQCFPGAAMHETNIARYNCAIEKSRGAFLAIYRDRLSAAKELIRQYAPECKSGEGCRGRENLGNN